MKTALVLLNKPAGLTSFECVRRMKKILGTKDVGHGGTLDKFATGVLPIFTGEGLKLARFCLESYPMLPTYWKKYRGTIELGTLTSTADPEGEILKKETPKKFTVDEIQNAMESFCNREYLQVPPRFSAKKIDGKRASDRVRDGENVEMRPSPVSIRKFDCMAYDGSSRIEFEADCSKGTYIRSLAVDLAEKLGTCAFVSRLERTKVGNYTLEDSCDFESLKIMDLSKAASFLPRIEISTEEARKILLGQLTDLLGRFSGLALPPGPYRAVVESGEPVALFEISPSRVATFMRAFRES